MKSRVLLLVVGVLLLTTIPAKADTLTFTVGDPNIIGFANATSCGGSTVCNNGSAFTLSTMSSWFGTPTSAQSFLVVNDTGHTITSLTLVVTGVFQATNGPYENFQIQVGAPGFFNSISLSGPGFAGYTQFPNGTSGAANFSNTGGPLAVTFTWSCSSGSTGCGIPPGAVFDLQTASWVSNVSPANMPEPSMLYMLSGGILGLVGFVRRATGFVQTHLVGNPQPTP